MTHTQTIHSTVHTEVIHRLHCERARAYTATLVSGLLDPDNDTLAQVLERRRTLIVTTPTVHRLYGPALASQIAHHDLNASILVLECNEQRKSLRDVVRVLEECRTLGMDRKGIILGFGGGVCTDIASLSASMVRRGIGYMRVPTTLLGVIDAGVGIKGGVNFAGKKSYVGCFYPPEAVLLDLGFLRSLPQPFLRYGMAEVIKIALTCSAELFELAESQHEALLMSGFGQPAEAGRRIVHLAAKRMMEQLEQNPYEDQTYKRLVDFGHTFSPLLESATDFTMHHGQAVAVDIALTLSICAELGMLSTRARDRSVALLHRCGLPIYSPLLSFDMCQAALQEACLHRDGAVNLVAITDIGTATFLQNREDIPDAILERSLAWLAGHHASLHIEDPLLTREAMAL